MAGPSPAACDTLAAAARAVAAEFLQTVVVVDDEANLDAAVFEPGPRPAPADPAVVGPATHPAQGPRLGAPTLNLTPPPGRAAGVDLEQAGVGERAQADLPDPTVATQPGATGAPLEATPEATPDPDPAHRLNAKALIDAFADMGLVCAMLRPSPSQTEPSGSAADRETGRPDRSADRTPPGGAGGAGATTGMAPYESTALRIAARATHRADIVVLDWDIYRDDGATARAILARMLRDSEAGPGARLRLVAFYTAAPDLAPVTARVEGVLTAAVADANDGTRVSVDRDGYGFTLGHARVVVYAKPGSRAAAAPGAAERVVSPSALPGRLVDDFAHLARGLIPQVALASMAALRQQTHRLLGRLGGKLDAAYLWQRAMQPRPADAEEHVVDVVAGELRAILDDSGVERWVGLDAIKLWLADPAREGTDWQAAFDTPSERSTADVAKLLEHGANGKALREMRADGSTGSLFERLADRADAAAGQPHRADIAGFAESSTAATRSSEEFAALMSLRTRYAHPARRLMLGTVVARGAGADRRWWLCVQPLCDSVRLSGKARFPLMPLARAQPGEPFDLVLPADGATLGVAYDRFRIHRKLARIESVEFKVAAGQDTIQATNADARPAFVASNGDPYEWIADLKPDYAVRAVQQLATELARVGLAESEWLRRWAAR